MQTRELLDRFYSAFQNRDSATMTSLYAADARFRDEVFSLRGRDEIGAMWNMLCKRGKDLSLTYEILTADAEGGDVRWIATYTFSATGRKVVNRIHARIRIANGLIVDHQDQFDFWKWSRQALGLPGLLLGWSGLIRNKVAGQAAKNLAAWRQGNAAD